MIWGSVAVFLLIAAFRGPGRRMGQFTSVLFRGSTGCLGLLILVIVSLVGVASRLDTDELARSFVEAYDPSDFAGLPAVVELSRAPS